MAKLNHWIYGREIQTVEMELPPGHSVIGEAGAMNYMDPDIDFTTCLGNGGIVSFQTAQRMAEAAPRGLTQDTVFINRFTNRGKGSQRMAFAAPHAGPILALDLGALADNTLICRREAFLCAAPETRIRIALSRESKDGKARLVLYRIQGEGLVFIHGRGAVTQKQLNGRRLQADWACVLALAGEVEFGLERLPPLASMFSDLTGDQRVQLEGQGPLWLQQASPAPGRSQTPDQTISFLRWTQRLRRWASAFFFLGR